VIVVGIGVCATDLGPLNYYPSANNVVTPRDFIVQAQKLLVEPKIPRTARLLTEDDIIYSLVVLAPDRYPPCTALQYFTVATEAGRRDILARTDYIWIALKDKHEYHMYLTYLPVPQWGADPFRLMIHDILRTHQPGSLYGYRFDLLDHDAERLLLKVAPAVPRRADA
jgi:hypothetical protein